MVIPIDLAMPFLFPDNITQKVCLAVDLKTLTCYLAKCDYFEEGYIGWHAEIKGKDSNSKFV